MNVFSLSLSLSVPPWLPRLTSPGSVPAAKNSWAGMCVHGTTVQDFIFGFISFSFLSSFLSLPLHSFFFFLMDICSQIFHEEKKELINWGWNILKGKRREREAWKHPQHQEKQRDEKCHCEALASTLIVNDSVGRFLTLKAAFVIKLLTQPLENKKGKKKTIRSWPKCTINGVLYCLPDCFTLFVVKKGQCVQVSYSLNQYFWFFQ